MLPFIVLGIFYPGAFVNTILYFINGSSVKVNSYTINFPLSHWAYFQESKNGFELSGIKVDTVNLEATVHEFDENIEPALEKLCNNVIYEKKQFKNITFKMYTCITKEDKKNIYFQTLDNNLVIETHTYKEDNNKNILEFKLLLDNIKKD